jgi:hypothetical protein
MVLLYFHDIICSGQWFHLFLAHLLILDQLENLFSVIFF